MRVLVYGTLKKGYHNHRLLAESELISSGEFRIPNHSLRLPEGYAFPFLYKGKEGSTSSFFGEIYEVNKETLKNLDRLEGHPDFYQREYIDSLDCFIYTSSDLKLETTNLISNF